MSALPETLKGKSAGAKALQRYRDLGRVQVLPRKVTQAIREELAEGLRVVRREFIIKEHNSQIVARRKGYFK